MVGPRDDDEEKDVIPSYEDDLRFLQQHGDPIWRDLRDWRERGCPDDEEEEE